MRMASRAFPGGTSRSQSERSMGRSLRSTASMSARSSRPEAPAARVSAEK